MIRCSKSLDVARTRHSAKRMCRLRSMKPTRVVPTKVKPREKGKVKEKAKPAVPRRQIVRLRGFTGRRNGRPRRFVDRSGHGYRLRIEVVLLHVRRSVRESLGLAVRVDAAGSRSHKSA